MKTSKKILAVILTIATLIGIFSCATTVFAEDYNEYTDNKAYQENLLTETVDRENEQAEIICEVEEKRDEYSKTYKRADGSFTSVLSQTPIHKLENGEWEEIDNTLKTEDEAITNTNGAFNVEFPETISKSEEITITSNGETLSFSVNGIEATDGVIVESETDKTDVIETDLNKTISQITYENVDDNTDIQYVVSSNSVKENIIVSDKASLKETYSFDIEKGNLSATLDNENNLLFKNAENETVFTIPAPVMTDANNTVSYDIEVEVQNADKSVLTLTYTPSKEWLESSERAYPVVIDPVVEFESSRGDIIADTVIGYSADEPGSENAIGVHNVEGQIINNAHKKSEILVKVNMDAFAGFKHPNVTVTNFNFVADGIVTNGNIYAKAINGSFNIEEITYSDVYPDDESSPIITYDEEIADFYSGKQANDEQTVDVIHLNITKLFNQWLSGERANNGFAIVADENAEGVLCLDGYVEFNTGYKRYYNSYCTMKVVIAKKQENQLKKKQFLLY